MALKRRHWVLGIFALLMVALVVWALRPKPLVVEVQEVTLGPLQVTVDEDGKTRIRERFVVSSPLGGRLLRIKLRPGDSVSAGRSLLAAVEPTDPALLDVRAQAMAEARAKATAASLKRAQAQLDLSRAAMDQAGRDLARVQGLAEENRATEEQLEQAELLRKMRAEEHRAARFATEIARFDVDQAEAALARLFPESDGERELARFEIFSPIDGQVLRVFKESADVVGPGTPLVELGDPSDLEVEVDVLSRDAVQIRPGASVTLEKWGGGALGGSVRLVEPSAFTKVSALGVEEQRVRVIVDLHGPEEKSTRLGDGYRVEAHIVIWEAPEVLRVPLSALFRHGEDWAVFLVSAKRAALRIVEIGQRGSAAAEVLGGLKAGDLAIAHPGDFIEDGAAVEIQ